MQTIEKEVRATAGPLPAPAISRADAAAYRRLDVQAADPAAPAGRLLGADHDQYADLRLRDFPAAILPAPRAHHHQLARLHRRAGRRLAGRLRVRALISRIRSGGAGALSSASVLTIVFGWIYARFNAGSDPVIVLSVGAVLIVAIYIQTALLFGVYTPELFPTEIRLRANGICNTLGRGATVVSPFVVGYLMVNYGLPGVVWLMIGLVVVQIIAVYFWGVEPAKRSLEGLDPKVA